MGQQGVVSPIWISLYNRLRKCEKKDVFFGECSGQIKNLIIYEMMMNAQLQTEHPNEMTIL